MRLWLLKLLAGKTYLVMVRPVVTTVWPMRSTTSGTYTTVYDDTGAWIEGHSPHGDGS